jgi:ABC exporter DevB family membrane fusion protein
MGRLMRKLLFCAAAVICVALVATAYQTRSLWIESAKPAPPPVLHDIVVRGRLEPSDGVYEVAAFSIAPTTSVGQVLVSEGQAVKKGEIVATLRSHAQAAAGVESAKAALAVVERRLDLTRRPYKESVVSAQQATIQARMADLEFAQSQQNRGELLYGRGVSSDEVRETRRAELSRAQARLEEARAQLQATTEVPSREILLAEAEVVAAHARLQGAQEELALTEIRAPADGTVLKVRAKSGELVSQRQIMDIGNFKRPKIVAEVDERMVPPLKIGQSVRATLRGHRGEWTGRISRIGGVVIAQLRPSADTVTGTGGRIVEVEAEVLDPSGLPEIAGLEMLVRIEAW